MYSLNLSTVWGFQQCRVREANLKAENTCPEVIAFTFLYNIFVAVWNTLIQDVSEITQLKTMN